MRRFVFAATAFAALMLAGCSSPEQKTQKAYEATISAFDKQIAARQKVEDESSATLTQMKIKQNEVWGIGKKAHDDVKVLHQLRAFADGIKNSPASVDEKQKQFRDLQGRLKQIGQ